MTSEQAMWCTAACLAVTLCLPGCRGQEGPEISPYPTRRVWAVAPLRNESGSSRANGLVIADHLARRLERIRNIDVLPVNRTLAAMQALEYPELTSPQEALKLLSTLGVDALVVGTITAYDPYDPPKLGITVELFVDERLDLPDVLDVRRLTRAATSDTVRLAPTRLRQPVTTVSAVYDASDPDVDASLREYAGKRGRDPGHDPWYLYRISMDLYTDFVSDSVSRRLLSEETHRLWSQEPPNRP